MGSFVFKWEHPASEVYVTGTFDNWSKSAKLDKVGAHFEKSVRLSDASKKIYYKFVVDGNWVTDHTAPKEADESGNENNVLTPERIVSDVPAAAALLSSAAPGSTTAALAAGAPLEKDSKPAGLPGTFPETPAAEADKTFSVNPLPAMPGGVNPIQLAPGEKIPAEYAAGGNVTGNVKLDPASYEKSDALPGVTPAIASAGPASTTAALAAGAPIETKVPEVVKESQQKAHVDPEASAVAAEVREKAAVEHELLDKVKPAPTTAEGVAGEGTLKTEATVTPGEAAASVAAAATAVGAAALAGAVVAKDTVVANATAAGAAVQTSAAQTAANLPDSVKQQLPISVQSAIGNTAKESKIEQVSPEVPAEVKHSIAEANKAPEAAANTEAVEEKKVVEAQLLKEVKTVPAVGDESEPGATTEKAKEKAQETVATAAKNVSQTADKIADKAANGGETATGAASSTATKSAESAGQPVETTAGADKKKKNRFSAFFNKLKGKNN